MKHKLNQILFEDEGNDFDFQPFIDFATEYLDLGDTPEVKMVYKIEGYDTFGFCVPMTGEVQVAYGGRHHIDVMRTIAHELVHVKQSQSHDPDGSTGSKDENEANAVAGIIMREYSSKAFEG